MSYAACLNAAAPASAQPYPTRPITMIVSAAGDLTDVFGRVLAEPQDRPCSYLR